MEHNKRKAALMLVLVLVLSALMQSTALAEALRVGSRGEAVEQLQTKLKRWGYYTGTVNGIFGAQTKAAVAYFQRRNGLAVDGIVGDETAKALGLTLSGNTNAGNSEGSGSSSDALGNLYLLARLVYGEARGEPYKGQVAVAAVVLNRVKSSEFPNSISGVIYQSGAFSVVNDGQINLSPDETAIKAARDAMNGWDPTNGCLYYYNPDKTTNEWMLSKPILMRIGNHVFFRG